MSAADADIQVVVIDDHPMIRRALEAFLTNRGIRVIGTASSAAEGRRLIAMGKPDVAVVDVDLGADDGVALAQEVGGFDDAPAILLYTGYIDSRTLEAALDGHVRGVALKTGSLEDLAQAVRSVAAGREYLDPQLIRALRDAESATTRLTPREREILGFAAAGMTADEIAARLVLSPHTVETHIRNAVRRLGARGRLHAVVLALQAGEISPAA